MGLLTGFVISLVVLDLIAICANFFFLYIIKTRPVPYNAIDVVQCLKTIFILFAAIICVWLELVVCEERPCTGIKHIFDDLFYHSSCVTFLCVAYIRRKVCECRGRASVLVTTKYAIVTFIVCLVPVFLFNAATLSLMSTQHVPDVITDNTTTRSSDVDVTLLLDNYHVAFEICRITMINLLPLVISCIFYARILQVVLQTSKTMGGNTGKPIKLITQSVVILISVTCTVWIVYMVARVASLFLHVDDAFFTYWKVVVIITHPFGEGLLQPSTRTSVRRVQEWVNERSVRRVSPTMSYDQDSILDSDDNNEMSLAEQLPTLIEERNSNNHPGQRSCRMDTEVMDSNQDAQGQAKARRHASIQYARPSILVRNAAYIGLECRDSTNILNVYRSRKDSRDKLRRELSNVNEIAASRAAARRLSTCLRLTNMDQSSDDEVYERYRNMYSRRGSSKYSDKSIRKNSDNRAFTPEYKALAYASNSTIRELAESSDTVVSPYRSPSRRRWKKMYTTAKTARKFAKLSSRKHQASRIEEDTTKHSVPSANSRQSGHASYPAEARPSYETTKVTKISKSDMDYPKKLSISSLSQKELYGLFAVQRLSIDNTPPPSTPCGGVSKSKPSTASKKRSISCVSNAWQARKEAEQLESNVRPGRRNRSVSFISGAGIDARAGPCANPRSLSYDAREYRNYQKQREYEEHLTRRSHGNNRYSRHSHEQVKVAHWLLEKNTTKEECIEKLIEMKDYF